MLTAPAPYIRSVSSILLGLNSVKEAHGVEDVDVIISNTLDNCDFCLARGRLNDGSFSQGDTESAYQLPPTLSTIPHDLLTDLFAIKRASSGCVDPDTSITW